MPVSILLKHLYLVQMFLHKKIVCNTTVYFILIIPHSALKILVIKEHLLILELLFLRITFYDFLNLPYVVAFFVKLAVIHGIQLNINNVNFVTIYNNCVDDTFY
jgi:hypothetical protein